MRRFALLVAAVFVMTACAKPAIQPEPPVKAATPAAQPAPVETPSAPPESPINKQNDLAFTLIKAKRWNEAIEAARTATEIDAKSSAAWFNLGRALLGAGRPWEAREGFVKARALQDSADAAYFQGQAEEAMGQVSDADQTYAYGLKQWPQDQELAAARTALKARYSQYPTLPAAVGDIDGDGKADLVFVSPQRLQLMSGTGAVLYEQQLGERPDAPVGASVFPQEGGAVVRVYLPGCPSAPANIILWFANGKLQQDKPGCGSFSFTGGAVTFTSTLREAPFASIATQQWDWGQWAPARIRTVVMFDTVYPEQIPWVLTRLAQAVPEVEGAQAWFDPPALYETFKQRPGPGRAEFTLVEGKGTPNLTFEVLLNGKLSGHLVISHANGKITGVKWTE